jgi:hypothetical protein
MVMTLKDKLRQNLTGHLSNDKTEVDVNIAAEIADDYAVEFLEWVDKNALEILWNRGKRTTKEILEIFKKEKGL